MDRYIFVSNSPNATLALGRRVGEILKTDSVIALIGELGCGKTLFTRGICVGLGVPGRLVNSPTFAFVNEYLGRLPVFHMDLYRLDNVEEGLEIGILDYLSRAETGVIIMEWAEKVRTLLPRDYLEVQFEVLSLRKRRLVLSGSGRKFKRLIGQLSEQ